MEKFDLVLKHFWHEPGTPFWKSHSMAIIFGLAITLLLVNVGIIPVQITGWVMIQVVVSIVGLTYLARKRFGNKDPN